MFAYAAFLAAACALLPLPASAAAAKRPVVVELFTSQGCESCLPADALLGQFAATRKDVIALSLPVTYWDMLGWKDTLASDGCTKRQKAYAQVMGRGGVYTPQMIVDGVTDVVGGRDGQVNAAIAARAADEQSVAVSITNNTHEVHVVVGAAEDKGAFNATIWMFRVMPQASVSVTAGENSGHTLAYRNVVRDIKAVGLWKGQAVTLDLPRDDPSNRDSIAVIVQQDGYGRILGAALADDSVKAATH
jgi:hypothetical protein